MLNPGSQFKPKNTAIVRKCGIDAKSAIATVLLASNGFVSFRLVSGELKMEARTTDELFRDHFQLTGGHIDIETEPEMKKHFLKNFPVDFM